MIFSDASKAFLISMLLYATLWLIGYRIWFWQPPVEMSNAHPVSVSLQMFESPATATSAPMIEQSPPIIEPEPEVVETPPTPEPIIDPLIEPASEPVSEPEPVKQPEPPKPLPETIPEPIIEPSIETIPEPAPTPEPPKNESEDKQQPDEQPVIEATPHSISEQKIIEPVAVQPQFSAQQIEQAEQRYLNELATTLARYAQDSYPLIARRRGWQGQVVVQFTLLASGDIINVTITNSSGRQILDTAAESIFTQQLKLFFKPFPAEIQRADWTHSVPIEYKLR